MRKYIATALAALALSSCMDEKPFTPDLPSGPEDLFPEYPCGWLDVPVIGGGHVTGLQFSALENGMEASPGSRNAYCPILSDVTVGYSDTVHFHIPLCEGAYSSWELAFSLEGRDPVLVHRSGCPLEVGVGDTTALGFGVVLGQGRSLLDFRFEPSVCPNVTSDVVFDIDHGNGTITARIDYYAGMKSMKPSFSVPDGYEVYVDGTLQTSGVSQQNFYHPVEYLIVSPDGLEQRYTATVNHFTGGPVLIIDTPGRVPITSREEWVDSTHIYLDGAGKYLDYEGFNDKIKGRGNATWKNFPKQPYNLKLEHKEALFGFPANKRWSLLANYRDRSRILNGVALHVGQQMECLDWTSHCEYCTLILNGEVRGLFQFTEQIRAGEGRVPIDEFEVDDEGNYTDLNPETITGGYLLQIDSYYDEPYKFKTDLSALPCELKHPNDNVPPEVMDYISGYFNEAERAMAASDWDKVHEMLDIDSFVDFWLCVSIMGCGDNGRPGSDFMHKKRMGKLYAGPIWDYDGSTFDQNFKISTTMWYPYLTKDPLFCRTLKEHWQKYQGWIAEIPDFIDWLAEHVRKERELDDFLWYPGICYPNIHKNEFLAYPDAIAYMKNFISDQNGRITAKIDEYCLAAGVE